MTSKLTETEIKMVIQSVIDDLGEPRAAQKWIDNKIHSIHYDQLTNGRTWLLPPIAARIVTAARNPELAARLSGSADLYGDDGRSAYSSINFVTCHDGFTLADLVSYNDKHNEDNGEDNNDGESHNRSWNCGVEGETDRADVAPDHAQRRHLRQL